ncbi:hypothetical protein Achl_1702 [Pseudarthrobacter chlorophenolicus A6]|uniref:Uncharacterized protein n=1 Tax=Pseudarthrobacter chlorophenolicus (strain ATCC 700700 / DSM 12829 / CIP 107037 / JCM 12360 / KCTC 9906 / NCIMB 13794 / A6) TaxID=452863 RepID=B8H6W6_PSECP|nr:hypothetical protein [Pseudarthrobacter chlorophenolicus]ACL39687.1 hypothetical protein Achl_1702 [Pseudarthrobacter chlorophenolicus A6]SDQ95373.1 hypothetical protein SAMN04489738_3803 [Pseudarthrobacter chlorophenolicus]
MKIDEWWPLVSEETRNWLTTHNGEGLTSPVVNEIMSATGGSRDSDWWDGDTADGLQLTDVAVDWIEATANGEMPPATK